MPNWKKVITSGSDAYLNSLNVTYGVTGSLFGTASYSISSSYSNFALTASYALNAGAASAATFPFTGSAIISGSLTVIGPTVITGSLAISGSGTGSIFTLSASYIDFDFDSFLFSGSTTFQGTLSTTTATASLGYITATDARITGSLFGTSSWSRNAVSSSFAVTASYALNAGGGSGAGFPFTGSAAISGSLTVNGRNTLTGVITAANEESLNTLNTTITHPATTGSKVYQSTITPTFRTTAPNQTSTALRVNPTFTGSNSQNIIVDFGAVNVGSQFTVNDITSGSIYMVNDISGLPILEATSDWTVNIYDYPNIVLKKTGSLIQVSGSLVVLGSGITGSLFGTSSWSQNALTASYVLNAVSASFSQTASYVLNAVSSSYSSFALTASYALNAIGGASVTVADEGTSQGSATFLDFTGAGVSVTVASNTASINIPGGAGSTFPYTGSAIISGSLVVTGSILVSQSYISTVDYVDFTVLPSPPTFNTGRLHWTDDTKTLQLDTDVNNFELEIGHQSVIRGRNENSFTITKGTVIYIDGQSGNRPTFATASWEDDPSSATTIGIIAQDINTSQTGYAVTNGLIRGVNTNAFPPGTSLYLSSSGQYTDTPAISPLHEVRLGKTITQAVDGIIYIDIQNGYELGELHDVLITNVSTGDLITWDSGSLVWKNTKQLTGSYGLTGSLQATSFTGSLFGTASWALNSVTSSYILNAVSSSYAETASYLNTINQDLTFNGNLTLNGTASITYLNVVYETASVIYSSGSNQLGDDTTDTQTLLGTILISGSNQITGSLTINNGNAEVLNTATFALKDGAGLVSVGWDDNKLYDGAATASLDWKNRLLPDASSYNSIDWQSRKLYYTDGATTIVDWVNHFANDRNGNVSINWGDGVRQLYDNTAIASVDWNNRALKWTDGTTTIVDWQAALAYDRVGALAIEWSDSKRTLYKSDGTTVSVDWEYAVLNDASALTSLDWASRSLLAADGSSISIDWGAYNTNDSSGNPSIDYDRRWLILSASNVLKWDTLQLYSTSSAALSLDWNNRQLIKSDGTTVAFDWENGILTGSLYGTASWAENVTSASFASTASYINGLITKNNVVAAGTFTGNPRKATVTFTTAFPNTNYSVTITGEDSRTWSIESKLAGSFIINTNSSVALSGNTYWIAVSYGEFNG